MTTPCCAIFDIGKTNKKLFLFNENYDIIWEKSESFAETVDEDGFPCENLELLTQWITGSFAEIKQLPHYIIKAVNYSGYGASFVHLDEKGTPITPLYNYLKPYSDLLLEEFYQKYGGVEAFSSVTASPKLGSLNSGLQLYRLAKEKPTIFEKIKYSLHLPQYLSFILSKKYCSDITSIGCHTGLWHFEAKNYHPWVAAEGVLSKLAPIQNPTQVIEIEEKIKVGTGLHDSSSALIPYMLNFSEPFILLSTGTWSISLNPFNDSPLTIKELQMDCLCYLNFQGSPVKASRIFAGNEHEVQTKRIAEHFNISPDFYKKVPYQKELIDELLALITITKPQNPNALLAQSNFVHRNIADFDTYQKAYHQLIIDLIAQQVVSTQLVMNNNSIRRIFVDGGFSKNEIYMHLLAEVFPGLEVYAADVAQASAIGAAMVIHDQWNSLSLPNNHISLKKYV